MQVLKTLLNIACNMQNMQNNMHDMQNMQMLFPICRICTAHFADADNDFFKFRVHLTSDYDSDCESIPASQYARALSLCSQLEHRIQQTDIRSVPTATCSRPFKNKSTVSSVLAQISSVGFVRHCLLTS